MSLSDARKMYVLLRDAGEHGVHSHELRHKGVSGNPSSRAKDIVSKGVTVWTARENVGRRPGARYWLAEHAPDWAVPVRPNRDVESSAEAEGGRPEAGTAVVSEVRSGLTGQSGEAATSLTDAPNQRETESSRPRAALSVTPAPEQVAVKEPVAIVRDYTDPQGAWREVPVSELDLPEAA